MSEIDDENDALIQEFLVDCNKGLDKLDQDLAALEKDPDEVEVLSGILRTLHTIKGAAGFLAFPNLASVAQAAESLLWKVRDGTLDFNSGPADALLRTVEVPRAILSAIESAHGEGETDCRELLENLKRLQHRDRDVPFSTGPADGRKHSGRPEDRDADGKARSASSKAIIVVV